ncbi:MAG: hypothetical protein J1F29_07145 [Lentimicrobiaceae bacterium]|nr:hypothetical protein [Lentimicrobiaceae bacterium]
MLAVRDGRAGQCRPMLARRRSGRYEAERVAQGNALNTGWAMDWRRGAERAAQGNAAPRLARRWIGDVGNRAA